MKYNNGSAFRRALEDRLLKQSVQTGMSLIRLRKMVAFDRFLARLVKNQPELWILKGGFALQLRLGNASRTTKDIDILVLDGHQDILAMLRYAGAIDLDDWFSFEVGYAETGMDEPGGKRYPLRAILDSRPFEAFHVDIGRDDPLIEAPDPLTTPGLLKFAGIPPTLVPCYPITQQIAEKLHAYTGIHASRENSRVKDFVDMLLLAGLDEIDGYKLRKAIEATFSKRSAHPLPEQLPPPPENWSTPYRRLVSEVGLGYVQFSDGFSALQKFLDPILAAKHTAASWDPTRWEWHKKSGR